MAATRKQVIDRCKELGVHCYDNGFDLELLCPQHHRLAGPILHCTIVNYRGSWGNSFMPKCEAWQALLDDLADGLELCEDPDCEWCEDDDISCFNQTERIA